MADDKKDKTKTETTVKTLRVSQETAHKMDALLKSGLSTREMMEQVMAVFERFGTADTTQRHIAVIEEHFGAVLSEIEALAQESRANASSHTEELADAKAEAEEAKKQAQEAEKERAMTENKLMKAEAELEKLHKRLEKTEAEVKRWQAAALDKWEDASGKSKAARPHKKKPAKESSEDVAAETAEKPAPAEPASENPDDGLTMEQMADKNEPSLFGKDAEK